MKKILSLILVYILLAPLTTFAQLSTVQGGTGTTSPSGILYGDGTLHMKTVVIGSNMTFSGGVLSSTGGGGGGTWPFTPAFYGGVANQSTTTNFYLPTAQIIASTTFFTMASTTGFTNTGSTWLTSLGTPAGTFLAVDPNGLVIATTSPVSGSASSTLLADNNTFTGANVSNGSLSLGVNTNGLLLGGNVWAYASSTNGATIFGIGAGGGLATTSSATSFMTAFGYQALASNGSGSSNTAFGYQAGLIISSGGNNTAIGQQALIKNTTGGNNTGIGAGVMSGDISGSNNVAVGVSSLANNGSGGGATTGSDNTAIGFKSLQGAFGAFSKNNTALGYQTGVNITTGYDNIFLGETQNTGGGNLTTGGGNILMGYNVVAPAVSTNLFLNIGNSIFGTLVATSSATSLPTSMTGIAFGIATSSLTGNTFSVQNAVNTNNVASFFSSTGAPLLTLQNAGNVGIGTTTPNWALTASNATLPQLALSDGTSGSMAWAFRNINGNFFLATSTAIATSTNATLQIMNNAPPSFSFATTSTVGILNLGVNSVSTNGTTTIHMSKIQFDGQDSTGAATCAYITGTSWVIKAGACLN